MTAAPLITYDIPRRRHPAIAFTLAQPLGAIGFVVILIMVGAGFLAPWVAPYDPLTIDFGAMLAPPGAEHPFGTDAFGRDILSRVIYGARTAMTIGFLA
jgi:peptide/nickel transport system permease protein